MTQPTEPIWRDTRFRIEMTARCLDCAAIPKVSNAGQIVTESGEQVQIMHNGIRVIAGGYYGETGWRKSSPGLRGHHEPQGGIDF